MVCFPLIQIIGHGGRWRVFADHSQEQGKPADHDLLLAERYGQIKLERD